MEKNVDIAGKKYWEQEWSKKRSIAPFDPKYYTNSIIDTLFERYLPKGKYRIMEIGCAFSSYLPYFYHRFQYRVSGFDYECDAVEMTKRIYTEMGMEFEIWCHDFFEESKEISEADILFSWGVFEHFNDLDKCLTQTRRYLKEEGYIVTVIPNMNGLTGALQKFFNPHVYDVHIPYTKEEMEHAHEIAGYEKLFCAYVGVYQAGVVNLGDRKYEGILRKILAIPGKPLFYFSKYLPFSIDSKFLSPYVLYIGKKK